LNMQKDRIIIQANTPELGEAEEEITVKSDKDEKISIGINAQFLIDSLKEMDFDYVTCGITGQMSPLTISPLKDRNYLSIIMPIQIKSSHNE
jgi:DNA polymerase-3 subunit beta